MPRRRLLLLVSVGLLLLGGVILLWPRKELAYEGRPLSAWVSELGVRSVANPKPKPIAREEISRATNALFHIGTNACPYLMKCIRYQQPRWKQMLFPIGNGLLAMLPTRQRLWDKEELHAYNAASAFGCLPAVPDGVVQELCVLLTDKDAGRRDRAFMAIVGQSRRSLPALLALVSNLGKRQRLDAIQRISDFRTNAGAAIPILMNCLTDRDPMIAGAAAKMLGELRIEPAVVIPALTNALQHPDQRAPVAIVSALTQFGSNALPPFSVLSEMLDPALNHSDERRRREATNALHRAYLDAFRD